MIASILLLLQLAATARAENKGALLRIDQQVQEVTEDIDNLKKLNDGASWSQACREKFSMSVAVSYYQQLKEVGGLRRPDAKTFWADQALELYYACNMVSGDASGCGMLSGLGGNTERFDYTCRRFGATALLGAAEISRKPDSEKMTHCKTFFTNFDEPEVASQADSFCRLVVRHWGRSAEFCKDVLSAKLIKGTPKMASHHCAELTATLWEGADAFARLENADPESLASARELDAFRKAYAADNAQLCDRSPLCGAARGNAKACDFYAKEIVNHFCAPENSKKMAAKQSSLIMNKLNVTLSALNQIEPKSSPEWKQRHAKIQSKFDDLATAMKAFGYGHRAPEPPAPSKKKK